MSVVAKRDSPDNKKTAAIPANPALNWLKQSGSRVGATAGVLLVRQGKKLRVVGGFPEDHRPDAELLLAARRAFTENALIVRVPDSDLAHLAYAMRLAGRPAVVALSLEVSKKEDDSEAIGRIAGQVLRRAEEQPTPARRKDDRVEQPSAEISSPASDRTPETEELDLVRQQGLLIASLASVIDQPKLAYSLHEMANSLQVGFRCLRVSVGLYESDRIRLEAVSREVNFDRRSALMVDLAEAMLETANGGATLVLPAPSSDAAPPQAHVALATTLKNPSLLSIPLVDEQKVIGVVLLERDAPFDASTIEAVERIAMTLAPIVGLQMLREMSLWKRFGRATREALGRVFGASYFKTKLAALAVLSFITWSVVSTDTFLIDSDAALEARSQRALVATFPSFLTEVEKRAGDLVERGDIVAKLDTREISLDRIKWEGELDKLRKEYRANLAQRDRSKVRVLEAQILQAQNQLNLIDAQIERATLRAPMDGVVISGDWAQALGKPVERGEKLFEIAALSDFDLILRVDEGDIGWVEVGATGALRLESMPDRLMNFRVTGITPVSEAGGGRNVFRVDAALLNESVALRPGMAGIAKIEIEDRSRAWIWTREFWNWMRMKVWRFGGV